MPGRDPCRSRLDQVGCGGQFGLSEDHAFTCRSAGTSEPVSVNRYRCLACEQVCTEGVQLGFEGKAGRCTGAVLDHGRCPVGFSPDRVGETHEHHADR
jgi:hypothetical protein